MEDIPTTHLYKVTARNGTYLGLLSPVTSKFNLTQDINNIGPSSIIVTVGQSIDTPFEPVKAITTEDGKLITTEDGKVLVTEGSPENINTATSKIRNGNKVEVVEYSRHNPNGKTVFIGRIKRWRGNLGTDEDVRITLVPLSTDTNNHVVRSGEALAYNQTTGNQSMALYSNNIFFWTYDLSTIGVSNLTAISLKLAAQNGSFPVTITAHIFDLCAAGADYNTELSAQLNIVSNVSSAKTSVSVVVSSTTPTEYKLVLPASIGINANRKYAVRISSTGASGTGGVVYYSYSNLDNTGHINQALAGDLKIGVNDGSGNYSIDGDIYAKLWYVPPFTKSTVVNFDPTILLKTIIDNYRAEGGIVSYTPTSIQNTGIIIPSYTFPLTKISEAFDIILGLCPAGFYYTIDPGTNILTFKQVNTSADYVLTYRKDIQNLDLSASIMDLKNAAYMVGGEVSGVNIFVYRENSDLVKELGVEMEILNDVRITNTGTAASKATNYVNKSDDEAYETSLQILDNQDLTMFAPGQTIGIRNLGTSFNMLIIPIVRKVYDVATLDLSLGKLPVRQSDLDLALSDQLQSLQTINNPNTPS